MNPKPQITRTNTDKSILIAPETPTNSLIWLHGLGDSSEGFFDYFLEQDSPVNSGTRVILLQAPLRAVTINGGMKSNSWYDIKGFGTVNEEDSVSIEEVRESVKQIEKAVEAEEKFWQGQNSKIPPHRRIFMGGFSQGCVMSLYYGLQCAKPLLGIVGFSGLLLQSTKLKNLGETKVLLYHGASDPVIPVQLAKLSYQKEGFATNKNVSFTVVNGLPHSVNSQQLKDTKSWMAKVLEEELKK